MVTLPEVAGAAALMRSALVWDNHGCMPLRPDDERFLPQLARYRAAGGDRPTPERFARHAAYVIDLVGPAHVGLGIDYVFDMRELDEVLKLSPTRFPTKDGFAGDLSCLDPEALAEVVEILLRWGYSEDALFAFLGGNLQRVAREVWRAPSLALVADHV